jgi:hypothetical protein
MKKILFIIALISGFGITSKAQIDINTNFNVLSNAPIDGRDTLTTLADTANVTWTYEGLLAWAADVNQFWVYNGGWWEQLQTGGGGGADSTLLSTNYRRDTAIQALRNEITGNSNSLLTGRTYFSQQIDSNNIVNVAIFGDSKTISRYRGTQQLADKLMKRYGNAGQGYYNFGTTAPWGLWFTLGGSVTTNSSESQTLGNHSIDLTGAGVQFTVYSNTSSTEDSLCYFTDFDLYYLGKAGGGTFDIKVDGGTVQTVNTSTTTGKTKISITGLSDAAHTVTFDVTSVGTGIRLYEGNFKRNINKGVTLHMIARGGYKATDIRDRLFQSENQTVLDDLDIATALFRIGANEAAGSANIDTMKTAIIAIADRVRNYNEKADITILGVEGIVGANNYNIAQKELVRDSTYGWIDLRAINPNWTRWTKLGYAEDNVHENEKGGDIIGEYIYNYFIDKYDNSVELVGNSTGVTGTGTTGFVPYFSNSSTIANTVIQYDGTETVTVAGNNVNNLEIGSNNWANINTVAGITSYTFWSEYDSNNSRFELTSTGAYPARWQSTTNIPLEVSKGSQGSVGSEVTFSRILTLTGNDNALTLSGYSTGSTITGITNYYAVFDSQGKLVPRSLADLKNELSLTKTANSLPYIDSNGALSTTSKNNDNLGGMGTLAANGWWYNINNDAGYIEHSYFAKRINSTELIATDAVRPSILKRNYGTSFEIYGAPITPTAGDTLNEITDFEKQLDVNVATGQLTLQKYGTGSTITGASIGFFGRTATGGMTALTTEETKEELGIVQEYGNAAGTTNGSGDLTVSHSLGTADFTAVGILETDNIVGWVQVVNKTSSDVTFRVFQFDGTAQASTITSIEYHLLKN